MGGGAQGGGGPRPFGGPSSGGYRGANSRAPSGPGGSGGPGGRSSFGGGGRPGGGGGRPGGRGRPFDKEREKDPFNEQVLELRRVTRVVAGGKRFRFRATIVIGDGKGHVGVGVDKGTDVQQSIQKAKADAKKNILSFRIVNGTIAHDVKAKFSAAEVIIRPSKEGAGLKAGGAVRIVLLLAGVKDASAKCLGGTKNKLTNAMAAIEALKKLKVAKHTAVKAE